MPLARFEKLDPARRGRLFLASRTEFAAKGFDGASLQPILAAAGASKGGLYYWFEDKTDLFAWVAGEVLTTVARTIGEPPAKGDLWAAWEERTRRAVTAAAEEPQGPTIARAVAAFAPGVREDARMDALAVRARKPYESWLAAGTARGAVRKDLPVDLLTDLVLGVEGSVAGWLARVDEAPDSEDAIGRIARLETRLVQRLVTS
jgi:AcrR family transcriptional regulator